MRAALLRRCIWILSIAFAMSAYPSVATSRNVHRALFYSGTPFGSLAWIKGAATRSAAKSKYTVEDLSNEICTSLPRYGAQWFMINHRDAELAGQVGYFAIRIVYDFGSGSRLPGAQTGIHLQRNGNWFSESGVRVPQDYQRNTEQISLPVDAFIDLHHPPEGKESESLAELTRAIGDWHMRPTADTDSSWSDRHLYGPMLRASLRGQTGAISARLIRFAVTDGTRSNEPVLFWLEPRGADSATIWVDAPRQEYTGSKRVYTVMFGRDCSEEEQATSEANITNPQD